MLDTIVNVVHGLLAVVGLTWWTALIVLLAMAFFGVVVMLVFGDLTHDKADLSKISTED